MAQVVGQSTATLSSTCPRYKTSISNLRSEEAMSTPASAIPPCPLTKAKLASANPYPTRLVPPHVSARLNARPSRTRQSPTIYQSRGCTAPHPPRLRAFCTGLRCRLMILARNHVVYWSIPEVLASMAARLPSLRPLLLASTSRRNPIIFPLASPPDPAVTAGPARSPPLRGTVGRPSLRPLRRRARRTQTPPYLLRPTARRSR